MLPKIWKKLLLAICIIAILFNITSKLVNRISLEKTLESSPEGFDIKGLLNKEEEPITDKSTVSQYDTENNDTDIINPVEQDSTEEVYDNNVEENDFVENQDDNISEYEQEGQVEEPVEEVNEGGMFDITDISNFTTLLY